LASVGRSNFAASILSSSFSSAYVSDIVNELLVKGHSKDDFPGFEGGVYAKRGSREGRNATG